jgi:acyl carrier protein
LWSTAALRHDRNPSPQLYLAGSNIPQPERGSTVADHSAKVKDIIEKELGVEREKLTTEASFIDDLGADSLDIVELVMEFEKEFNIDIPDEDAEKLRTVGDAINYLNQKIGA